MKKLLVSDGSLTLTAQLLLGCVTLLGFVGIPLFDIPLWLAIPLGFLSLVSGSILMFEGRAAAIGLKPFTRDPLNWRKAKKTYEQGDGSSEK